MKKFKTIIILSLISMSLYFYGCNQEGSPSIYEEEPVGDTPVITGVTPENSALAGVTEVTINGSNFSSVPENNFVYFGTAKATVLSANPSQLVVRAPILIKNNIDVKVAVHKAENFSNKVVYNLLEAVGEYYDFKSIEIPYAMTIDNNNNIYFSLKENNFGKGIMKLTPDGIISNFAPKGGEDFFNDLKMGKNNILYGARNVKAIFAIEEGVAPAVYAAFPAGTFITDLDFDANGNIWAGGIGNNIFSVDENKNVNQFPVNYRVYGIRVFDNYLYVAGKNDTEEAIYRFQINAADNLGTQEKYFDVSGIYGLGTLSIQAMTFAADGDLYLGADKDDAIIVVHPDKSNEDLYPGLIKKNVIAMEWGNDENLYYTKEATPAFPGATKIDTAQTILKVNMQKLGAPYYGRN